MSAPRHSRVVLEKVVFQTQAERIIARFGGPRRLSHLFTLIDYPYTARSIYRWNEPRPKGNGGLVPTHLWPYIFEAARYDGVGFSAEDCDPRPSRTIKHKYLAP